MKHVSILISALWCLSLALNVSPVHSFSNKPNYAYSCIILFVVLSGASLVARTKVATFTRSISSSRYVSAIASFFSIILVLLSLYIGIEMVGGGGFSLGANREVFENKYYYFNYIFILTIPLVILTALSSFSSTTSRKISIWAWVSCAILLLLSGNRQFFFFSVSYTSIYYLGKSQSPKLFFKRILSIGSLIFVFIVFFSIFRLDYLGSTEGNVVAKYMSTLTGAECTGESFYCDSFAEAVFQLSYAYLGMNHSGLAYSIDFYYQNDGFSALSSTFPMLYRRFESLFSLNSYAQEQSYKNYVAAQAGGEYSNFFSTMFGAFGIELGWVGIVIYSMIILFLTWYFSIRCSKKKATELDYNIFILIITAYVFGIMQPPTTEPFFFLIITMWSMLALINVAAKK